MTHSKSELRSLIRAQRRARLNVTTTTPTVKEPPASNTLNKAETSESAAAIFLTGTNEEIQAALQTQWENACLFFGIRPWSPHILPALFVPTPTEPPIHQLLARSPRCLLPLLFEGERQLSEPAWGLSQGGEDLLTCPAPWPAQPRNIAPENALAQADIILVPALAIDEDGVRLGQGGGWYDRALLTATEGTPIVGVVFDEELLPGGTLPMEPHDHLLDAVITPTRFLLLPVHG